MALVTALNSSTFSRLLIGLYIPNRWNATRHTAAVMAKIPR